MTRTLEPKLAIGAVSAATGIPESTLRTWERRYGWPTPDRSSGQQRLYDPAVVERLRLVARALGHGHRPAQVLLLEAEDLAALIGRTDPGPPSVDQGLIGLVRALDTNGLDAALRRGLAEHGLLPLIEERVAPLLVEVGQRWASGDLQVVHEHFLSERVEQFLAAQWRALAGDAVGPIAACATLPGESHALGIHLAAAALALSGCRVLFLGPSCPLDDLVDGVAISGASALCVSVSAAASPEPARRELESLRGLLPGEVALVIGGAGAPPRVSGVRGPMALAELGPIVAALPQRAGRGPSRGRAR